MEDGEIMPVRLRRIAACLLATAIASGTLLSEAIKRPVTARDCIEAHYLDTDGGQQAIAINPQGTLAAYLVKSPNLKTNENDIELYVRAFPGTTDGRGRLLGSNVAFSSMHWLRDGRHISILMESGKRVVVGSVDAFTGATGVLVRAEADIEEYSTDATGDTIVYSTEARSAQVNAHTEQEDQTGYRIPNQGNPAAAEVRTSLFREKDLYVVHRLRSGAWSAPKQLTIRHPLSGNIERNILCTNRFDLALSPDGHSLLLTLPGIDLRGHLGTSGWPAAWKASPNVQRTSKHGTPIMLSAMLDLDTGRVTMPLPTPYVAPNSPVWAPDGRSFLAGAMSPVGSRWEADDTRSGIQFAYPFHLWRIDLASGRIQMLRRHFPGGNDDILSYSGDQATVRTGSDRFVVLRKEGEAWNQVSATRLPLQGFGELRSLVAVNGYALAGYENTVTPPEIILYKVGSDRFQVVGRLDPQFDQLTLAEPQPFSWKTSTGVRMDGLLFLPTDYVRGRSYPLVIETKSSHGQFLCDGGEDHPPSFAPQPLANDGFAYLLPTTNPSPNDYPKGYPGGIAEAVFYTGVWDSAVAALSKEGVIDPNKVGIIGFSRTGWHVEYALTHGETRYAAATVADNVQYSYGEYWADNAATVYARMEDAMYDGPPFGATLKNWLRYSLSFNLQNIHAPLLMEAMGYGIRDNHPGEIPFNLVPRFEVLAGLTALSKPVEMYYYPDETHEPNHPKARLASLERNIDWYRFWLQGYERPGSGVAAQYERWEGLKKLHQRDVEGPVALRDSDNATTN